jgi:hypothetical protein
MIVKRPLEADPVVGVEVLGQFPTEKTINHVFDLGFGNSVSAVELAKRHSDIYAVDHLLNVPPRISLGADALEAFEGCDCVSPNAGDNFWCGHLWLSFAGGAGGTGANCLAGSDSRVITSSAFMPCG